MVSIPYYAVRCQVVLSLVGRGGGEGTGGGLVLLTRQLSLHCTLGTGCCRVASFVHSLPFG